MAHAGTMARLVAVTLLLGAGGAVAGEQSKDKEQKIPKDVPGVLRLARRYVAEERRLTSDGTEQSLRGADRLVGHWRQLRTVRLGLERLEGEGALARLTEGQRIATRHVLAQILGAPTEIGLDGDRTFLERVVDASYVRAKDLGALARLANRAFDFELEAPPAPSAAR